MNRAPFRDDLAEAPEGGTVVWRKTEDDVRLRMAWWSPDRAKATVLLLPGRTEYIEKYGRIIGDLTRAGHAVVTLDWRGQGLSDRPDEDRFLGHIKSFLEYQQDVAALLAVSDEVALPGPRFLLAHSMGGCIGLRALVEGLEVARAVFTAPMWGLQLPPYVRALPHIVPPIARLVRKERQYAPGTRPVNYVTDIGFEENLLTTDRATFDWLARHAVEAPELALGGPSVQWVGEAARETRLLFAAKRPALPVLTFLGADEKIVSPEAIRRFHANWPSARLIEVEAARHEIMMEAPGPRRLFLDETLAFFDAA